MSAVLVAHDALAAWGATMLRMAGVPADDAARVADALVQTSLWGIDSHGIARLTHYLNRIGHGSIETRPRVVIERTGAATASVDGGHGLGIAIAFRANALAMTLARSAGAGVVGVTNTTHCGAIGLYAREAARAGFVAIAFTHADSIVAPHGGSQKFLGTNPIAIAVPRADGPPVCLDMATSSIPWNRVMNARREAGALPEGVAIDAAGAPTTDPQAAAALLPLGGSDYGHKGYALALMIDLLCGPLNAMAYANHITPMFSALEARRRLGTTLLAIDPARFAGGATLAQAAAAMAREVAALPGRVRMPGDPELENEARRRALGIPVEPGLAAEFRDWSARLGVAPPL